MENEIVPIFTTHHSIGESILTVEKEKTIEQGKPVSVLAIAKQHGENGVFVVDSDISSYWKLYKNSTDLGLQLVYGVKLTVCANLHDKEESSELTESSVIVVFNNSKAFYEFTPLYSLASTTGYRKGRRIDWKTLNERWSDNFSLYLPFYSSFIARNLMWYDHKAIPLFSAMTPTFFSETHGLPFDAMIQAGIERYVSAECGEIQRSHQIYYYKDADVMPHLTLQCIHRRKGQLTKTWDRPNLEHYGSDEFSYESYLRLKEKCA